MRRKVSLGFFLLLAGIGPLANAQQVGEVSDEEMAAVKKKVPWRGSRFIWGHDMSAITLSKGAESEWNPYYAQTFWFMPRWYFRDDFNVSLREIVEIEISTSDDTDRRHQAILTDMWLDLNYAPKFLVIPRVDIKVSTGLRFILPTSIESRGRSLVMTVSPGFNLTREFKLRKGKYLNKLELMYLFRASKSFNKYAYSQVADLGCSDPNRPECLHQGKRNISWSMFNGLNASLQITPKLSFDAGVFFFNSFLYAVPSQSLELGGGETISIEESRINHKASLWVMLNLSYEVFDYLHLSVGTSTYAPAFTPDSSIRAPVFNRYTNLFFWVTVPVDKFIEQVQSWTGRGRQATPATTAGGPTISKTN